jgi:hypothetical protein
VVAAFGRLVRLPQAAAAREREEAEARRLEEEIQAWAREAMAAREREEEARRREEEIQARAREAAAREREAEARRREARRREFLHTARRLGARLWNEFRLVFVGWWIVVAAFGRLVQRSVSKNTRDVVQDLERFNPNSMDQSQYTATSHTLLEGCQMLFGLAKPCSNEAGCRLACS